MSPELLERLEALDAKLREHGMTLEQFLALAAHKLLGIELKD